MNLKTAVGNNCGFRDERLVEYTALRASHNDEAEGLARGREAVRM
jgi:hypothetical protein